MEEAREKEFAAFLMEKFALEEQVACIGSSIW